jgi:DNA primase
MRITEQIKRAINADTYISGLLPVKNGRALCPFHGEKTPSFRVHKDYFKCFGCGAGGDVITFAAKYHQISVGSAIRMLAREAGVTLTARG